MNVLRKANLQDYVAAGYRGKKFKNGYGTIKEKKTSMIDEKKIYLRRYCRT